MPLSCCMPLSHLVRDSIKNHSPARYITRFKKRQLAEVTDQSQLEKLNEARRQKMRSVNPRVVLKNYLAEQVIREAEKEEFTACEEMLELLQNPFGEAEKQPKVCQILPRTPEWGQNICVSCSS